MNKIMFVGDTHGDLGTWHDLAYIARQEEVETIIQLGDFGYFPNRSEHNRRMVPSCIGKVSSIVGSTCRVVWLDGNHEDHDQIEYLTGRKLVRDQLVRSIEASTIVCRTHPREISYAPRGSLIEVWPPKSRSEVIEPVMMQAMGGAYSVDKDWRLSKQREDYKLWWAQEEITDEQLEAAIEVYKDAEVLGFSPTVLVCHDAPEGAPIDQLGTMRLAPRIAEEASFNRRQLKLLCEVTKPKYIFHGHFHNRLSYTYDYGTGTAEVVALSSNPESQADKVVSIENMYTIRELDQLR